MLDSKSLIVGVVAGSVAVLLLRLRPKQRKAPAGELWASPLTTCSRRAIMACVEAGVHFKFVPIHLAKGEHKRPDYMTLQPYGKVPAWRDNSGFDLFESRAICRHVGEGTHLVPAGAAERAPTITSGRPSWSTSPAPATDVPISSPLALPSNCHSRLPSAPE